MKKLEFGQLQAHLFVECKRQSYQTDMEKRQRAEAQLRDYMVDWTALHPTTNHLYGLLSMGTHVTLYELIPRTLIWRTRTRMPIYDLTSQLDRLRLDRQLRTLGRL